MSTAELIEKTEFHDLTLVELRRNDGQIHLRFEDVCIGNDDYYDVTVDLGGVGDVTCNGTLVSSLGLKAEDAAVISFKRASKVAP